MTASRLLITTMFAAALVGAGVGPVAARADEMADEMSDPAPVPPFRCSTFEDWLARGNGPDPLAINCPKEGDCDIPQERDGYLIDNETTNRWLRVHILVFRDDDGANPAATAQEVDDQMQTLNADYQPWRIQFNWTWEFIDDSAYRQINGGQQLQDMKNAYSVDPSAQCNVFVTGFFSGGGQGTFPWDPVAMTPLGGIVLDEEMFSGIHHALTHEMGHALGLWHTHHGVDEVPECGACYERADGADADETGDFCGDTPPRPRDSGLCAPPGGDDPCSGFPWGDTQPENYMSYGSDDGIGCWTQFTPQQAARMHCWIDAVRLDWYDCRVGEDCNQNGIPDRCDIRDGYSDDDNHNGIPDECDQIHDWIENFDGYPPGPLPGRGGWAPWGNGREGAGFEITADVSRSAPHALAIDATDDAVRSFVGVDDGRWRFTAWLLVPAAMDDLQHFILLNTYPVGEGYSSWSLQLEIDGANGLLADRNSDARLPLARGEWAEIVVDIDLEADTQTVRYDGAHLLTKGWSNGVSEGGATSIAAVDLWGTGSAHVVYYDDVSLGAPCAEDLDGSGDVGFPDLLAVLAAWGPCGACPEDLDGSGDVGFDDLLILLAAWGPCE